MRFTERLRQFKSLAEENVFLERWESQVADKRIHGTTRKQVAACFEQERHCLQPLPDSLFPSFQEAMRNVHRDSYVEVARAYYEVPAELIGHQVWVRWDSRCVRIFNQRMEQVQIHTRIEPGRRGEGPADRTVEKLDCSRSLPADYSWLNRFHESSVWHAASCFFGFGHSGLLRFHCRRRWIGGLELTEPLFFLLGFLFKVSLPLFELIVWFCQFVILLQL